MTKTKIKKYGATVDVAIRMYVEYEAEDHDIDSAEDHVEKVWRDQLNNSSDINIEVVERDEL